MRVHRHHLLLPQHGTQHVGRLAPHARQALHLLQVARHLAPELFAQHTRHAREVAGLVVRVGDAPDIGVNLLGRGLRHFERRGEALEQGGRSHVDPLVGTLRRKDHGHEQLVGIRIVQFALGHGHVLREPGDNAVVTLFGSHSRCFLRRNKIFFTRSPQPSGQNSRRGQAATSRRHRARYSPTEPFQESTHNATELRRRRMRNRLRRAP